MDKSIIIINRKKFKQYKDTIYYVSKDGEIYSSYANKIIKKHIRETKNKKYEYIDIYSKKKKKQQHVNVHKIVFETWVRKLKKGEQINHKDDNSLNNKLSNLYVGGQKDNINDCIKNDHRVGNVFYLTVYDKEVRQILTFCPSNKFIEYCGHPSKNGYLNKFFNKNWFKKRYVIVDFKKINNLDEFKSVTTMGDECSPVE